MNALVLSGGGAKGAYQVGVLKRWMGEQGKDYDAICGISVGAINGAHLAQFAKGNSKLAAVSLEQLWSRVNNHEVKRSWFPFGVLSAVFKPSVFDSTPLHEWIKRELRSDEIQRAGRQLRVVAVSWDTGEIKVADESDPDLAAWVIASSAFPVMLTPIEIGGQLWADGGLRSVTPLGEAIRLGANDIDVIMCSNPFAPSPFQSRGKAALPSLALRAVDILTDQIMRSDLELCGLKNDLARASGPHRLVKLRLVQPSRTLTDDALDFDPAKIENMIRIGYDDAGAATDALSFSEVRSFTKRAHPRVGPPSA